MYTYSIICVAYTLAYVFIFLLVSLLLLLKSTVRVPVLLQVLLLYFNKQAFVAAFNSQYWFSHIVINSLKYNEVLVVGNRTLMAAPYLPSVPLLKSTVSDPRTRAIVFSPSTGMVNSFSPYTLHLSYSYKLQELE